MFRKSAFPKAGMRFEISVDTFQPQLLHKLPAVQVQCPQKRIRRTISSGQGWGEGNEERTLALKAEPRMRKLEPGENNTLITSDYPTQGRRLSLVVPWPISFDNNNRFPIEVNRII